MLPNNIYFILGVPCSGKTTVAKLLCKKHKMYYFSGDGKRFEYFNQADKSIHSCMTRDMSDFWELPCEKLIKWEQGVIKEQTPMIIYDLEKLSKEHEKIIFEGILDLNAIASLVNKNRIIYLTVNREIRKRDFYNRADHIKMLENIKNNKDISDIEKERRIDLRRNVAINFCPEDVIQYGITQLKRYDDTNVSDIIEFVERNFELNN